MGLSGCLRGSSTYGVLAEINHRSLQDASRFIDDQSQASLFGEERQPIAAFICIDPALTSRRERAIAHVPLQQGCIDLEPIRDRRGVDLERAAFKSDHVQVPSCPSTFLPATIAVHLRCGRTAQRVASRRKSTRGAAREGPSRDWLARNIAVDAGSLIFIRRRAGMQGRIGARQTASGRAPSLRIPSTEPAVSGWIVCATKVLVARSEGGPRDNAGVWSKSFPSRIMPRLSFE